MPELSKLLERTSRTFALCVPLLPEPTRREVTLAYLLFRIADTFEDAAAWPPEQRISALADFSGLLGSPSASVARRLATEWVRQRPSDHQGYLDLLHALPYVLDELSQLRGPARGIVVEHACRSAAGMSVFVARTDESGELRLRHLDELRRYCYAVAGLVGDLLTELFLLDREFLAEIAPYLRPRARHFGEALQLTNILKDARADAREGRYFLPASVDPRAVLQLARQDLDTAADYTLALQAAGAPRGLVAFCALPARLARATLDRVEERGAGAALSRPEVFAIISDMNEALDHERPAIQPRPGVRTVDRGVTTLRGDHLTRQT